MGFVEDSFTDVAGTALENHVGEVGATWAKHPSSGTPQSEISAGGRLRDSGPDAIYFASGVSAFADYDVATDAVALSTDGYGSMICARMDLVANTFYGVRARGAGGNINRWEAYRRINGLFSLLGSSNQAWTLGATYRVVLRVRGSRISVLVDGVERITGIDSTITAAGRVGIRTASSDTDTSGFHLDNVLASNPVRRTHILEGGVWVPKPLLVLRADGQWIERETIAL
jgi:hypothetical protein